MLLHFGLDTTLPFLADFVPMLVAIVGIIMSYRQPRQKDHALATFVLIITGLGGTGILSWARLRGEATHKTEMAELNKKIQSVGSQNSQILSTILQSPPQQDARTKEVLRRQSILTLLRNEYVLSHDDISASLLAGAEQPPANWVNGRLKQLGEAWTVQDNPKPRVSTPFPTQVINSPDPYVGTSSTTVVMWAVQEADNVEASGRRCVSDLAVASDRKNKHIPVDPSNGFFGPEFIQASFWQNYSDYHESVIAKLHDSLIFRLSPVATGSEEQGYRNLQSLAAQAKENPKQSAWALCFGVQDYAEELRRMAAMVNR
jgi:hypothetical protein